MAAKAKLSLDDLNPNWLEAGIQLRGNHCVPLTWDKFYFEMTMLDGGKSK